jgi:hypothetical protein
MDQRQYPPIDEPHRCAADAPRQFIGSLGLGLVVNRHRHRDAGSIVLGWLVKVALVLAVIFVVGYDVIAITYNKVATSESARSVARAAYDARVLTRSTQATATKVAQEQARVKGVTLTRSDVVFGPDDSIKVTVSRSVDTLLIKRIGPLADYAIAVESYQTSVGQ